MTSVFSDSIKEVTVIQDKAENEKNTLISDYELKLKKLQQELDKMKIENGELRLQEEKQKKLQQVVENFKIELQEIEEYGEVRTTFVSQYDINSMNKRVQNLAAHNQKLEDSNEKLHNELKKRKMRSIIFSIILGLFNLILIILCVYLAFSNSSENTHKAMNMTEGKEKPTLTIEEMKERVKIKEKDEKNEITIKE